MTDLLTENARLRAALEAMLHAVCSDSGFAAAVRQVSGLAYPWPALDDAEANARAALATPAPDAPDLTDPVVVHANMLRGTIAKPSVAQIIHLYGSAVFLELLYKRGLCKPTAHDAQSGVYWCAACRNTNAIHCAHPDECGNMRRITRDEIAAQADSWKAWLDDLPLPEFKPAIDDLQDYLTIAVNALFTLNIEDEQPKPPAPDAVQDAARVPEVAALIEAATALGVRAMVAGWNGEGREHPYTPHPSRLGATIKTTCGAVYALDAALRAIAGSEASHE